MLWKESYKLGMEHIDRQHKELFHMTKHLLTTLKSDDSTAMKQECIETVRFLKGYSLQHFDTEEKYMHSINYCDIEAHKDIHKNFIDTVLQSEKKMLKYDFSLSTVKEFAGFLTAWLIYHVADADQKIKNNEPLSRNRITITSFYLNCFVQSISSVLKTMIGLTATNFIFDPEPVNEGDILVHIGLIGDFEGDAVFIFPKETTFGLIKEMTSMELNEIDEIAYSALSEISNIVSGNAASLVAESGRACDIKTPLIILDANIANNTNGFRFDTEYGKISVCINL